MLLELRTRNSLPDSSEVNIGHFGRYGCRYDRSTISRSD